MSMAAFDDKQLSEIYEKKLGVVLPGDYKWTHKLIDWYSNINGKAQAQLA